MRNTAQVGNAAERFVAKDLSERGFVVASRRHIGGAGDLLAVHPNGTVWLVEVKKRKSVYAGFTRPDREAMTATPLPKGGERWLAAVQPGGIIKWVHEMSWPPIDKANKTPPQR